MRPLSSLGNWYRDGDVVSSVSGGRVEYLSCTDRIQNNYVPIPLLYMFT